jgi:hypothetical protein
VAEGKIHAHCGLPDTPFAAEDYNPVFDSPQSLFRSLLFKLKLSFLLFRDIQ